MLITGLSITIVAYLTFVADRETEHDLEKECWPQRILAALEVSRQCGMYFRRRRVVMRAKSIPFWGLPSRARITSLDWMNAFALGSLFFDIKTGASGSSVTPFPFFALIAGLLTVKTFGFDALKTRKRFIPHIVFLIFINTLFAYRVDIGTGIRETVQAVVIIGWIVCFATTYTRTSADGMIRVFVGLIFVSMTFTIAWHLAHGIVVGWKLLDNAKSAFDLLPAIVCGWIVYRRPHRSAAIIGSIAVAVLIVLSGERKGIFIGIAALMITYGFANKRFLGTMAFAAIFSITTITLFSGSYVGRQLNTLMDPDAYQTQNYVADRGSPVTMSNLARLLTFKIGIDRFVESPVFGMGTGAYRQSVFAQYPDLPLEFAQGIHNEFFRVAVENGLFGLAFYIWAWISAGRAIFSPFRWEYFVKGFPKEMRLQTILFMSCLIHVSVQANNTLTVLAFFLAPNFDLLALTHGGTEIPGLIAKKKKPLRTPLVTAETASPAA